MITVRLQSFLVAGVFSAVCLLSGMSVRAAQEAGGGAKLEPVAADKIAKVTAALPVKPYATPAAPRKVLVFTFTQGFRHSSIPIAAKTLELMGEKTGAFTAVVSADVEMLKPEKLAEFDVFCSDQCTGRVTGDEALKKSLIDFVKNGKGWVGIHASNDVGGWRFPEYFDMIGGVFAGHPFRRISVKLDDPASPLNAMFNGSGFEISDEIYTFKEAYSREKVRVLLSIDWGNSNITQGANRDDNDYALSWIREYGKGRVFYCAFGHDDEIWWNPAILKHYLAGIQYACGDLKVDATPSSKVTIAPARGPVLAPPPPREKGKDKKKG